MQNLSARKPFLLQSPEGNSISSGPKSAGGGMGWAILRERCSSFAPSVANCAASVDSETMPRIVEALRDAARHISMQLGYRVPRRRATGV